MGICTRRSGKLRGLDDQNSLGIEDRSAALIIDRGVTRGNTYHIPRPRLKDRSKASMPHSLLSARDWCADATLTMGLR